jgi:hypothetical protein
VRKIAPRSARHYTYVVGVFRLEPPVPVTARLSKAFYDQFGEQVTNELVEWLNVVDATYRAELRMLNDTNFARFEAVLDARFAHSDARLERRLGEWESRFELRFREQVQLIERRFQEQDQKLDQRFMTQEQVFDRRFKAHDARFDQQGTSIVALRAEMDRRFTEQLRWMVGLWMLNIAAMIGVLVAVLALR